MKPSGLSLLLYSPKYITKKFLHASRFKQKNTHNFLIAIKKFLYSKLADCFLYRNANVDYNMVRGLPKYQKWDFLGKIWQTCHYWELYFICYHSNGCVYHDDDLWAYNKQTAWRQSYPVVWIWSKHSKLRKFANNFIVSI